MSKIFDLETTTVRALNQALHDLPKSGDATRWQVLNPKGEHAIACGADAQVAIEIIGHAGYYCAGMNQLASIDVHGNVGTGVAENMMSGTVRVRGNASQSAGATAHGGLLVIEGNAAARCGISLKGSDIVVQGSVGHMSAFMAQKGNLVICGDAGPALGDSIYEANIFLRGKNADLGADCEEKEMDADAVDTLGKLLAEAEVNLPTNDFRRYGSARNLYHFDIKKASSY
ncbi:MAG: GltB/FmdC/FwdC-like GXGXG domain-containing protein [Gammaproteobacteria bacterium]